MLEDFRLKVFATSARTGSFTKAAKELDISQPAVTQNISNLENELGKTLFIRSKTSLSLTGEGRIFKWYAEEIISRYETLDMLFKGLESYGTIRIHADAITRSCMLPDIVDKLKTLHPKLEVIVCEEKECADIQILSAHYKISDSVFFKFTVQPESHPLAKIFSNLIKEQKM